MEGFFLHKGGDAIFLLLPAFTVVKAKHPFPRVYPVGKEL